MFNKCKRFLQVQFEMVLFLCRIFLLEQMSLRIFFFFWWLSSFSFSVSLCLSLSLSISPYLSLSLSLALLPVLSPSSLSPFPSSPSVSLHNFEFWTGTTLYCVTFSLFKLSTYVWSVFPELSPLTPYVGSLNPDDSWGSDHCSHSADEKSEAQGESKYHPGFYHQW